LGFLGRLEHNQKGVFHLPDIARELNARGVSFTLRIAGKGKHRQALEKMLCHQIDTRQVQFLGALIPDEVPDFLAETDVFLFPSHFEGFPNALLEALMAGCVPVCWLIEGITDFILDDGKTGFLCPTGDHSQFADHIEALALDRGCLQRTSGQVARVARERFSNRTAAAAYAALIKDVMGRPPLPYTPKPWDQFTGDPNFEHHWTDWLRDVPLVEWLNRKLQNQMGFRGLAD
jgi:glycosyltransferase involved in cell wall biosynthesis